MSAISCHLIFECSNCLSAGCQNVLRKCRFFRPRCSEYELFSSKLFILWPNSVQHLGNTECLKPGFHIVVSVVSVVRKKLIGQIQLYGNLPYKCSIQEKRQIQVVVRDRMNYICPMNCFRMTDTTETTDTTIWKPGLKENAMISKWQTCR